LMSVNSDDGYVLSSAPNPRDTLGTLVAYMNAGGGSQNPPGRFYSIVILEDGIYPFRLVYWEGGSGANIEWIVVEPGSGQRGLVNDAAAALPLTAYRNYTGPAKPWVKFSVYPLPSRWDNTFQQTGPGPIIGRIGSPNPGSTGWNPGDWANGAPGSNGLTNRPFADGVGAVIANLGSNPVRLILDGAEVTPTLTPLGADTLVEYKPATPLSPAEPHTATLVYAGVSSSWTFNVQGAPMIPESFASEVDTTKRGFRARVVKVKNGTANIAGNILRAENHLRGELKDAAGVAIPSTAVLGPEADGSYIVPEYVNWNQERRGGNNSENGWFTTVTARPDVAIPGIGLATTGEAANANDLISAEIFAYLELPAGYIKMGINSDDGFRVTAAAGYEADPLVLGVCDGGKGSSDVPFSFVTPKAGLYPIRIVWFEGGGGANIEIFSYGANGEKILVNDPNNPQSIKAYYQMSARPQITKISRSGGNLTIEWTGGGTLETTDAVVGGTWTGTTLTSPAVIPESQLGNIRFARVRR
ncbi:MAG: hypothetical protein Q7R41_02975, partial [Phycisphaerales bacterium]|nr:hypothetical protein [Phycisphaerales bacterium]